MSDPQTVKIAGDAVVDAARVARAVQRDPARVQAMTKDDRSPVTVADFAVQAIIAMALRQADPEARIAGEEHAADLKRDDHRAVREAVVDAVRMARPDATEQAVVDAIDACDHDATAESFWTLDPVDGTKGFLRGGQYAIALARIEHGTVTFGVLGCPNLSPDRSASVEQAAGSGVMCWATPGGGGGGAWQVALDDGGHPGSNPARLGLRPAPHIGPPRICWSVDASHSNASDTQRLLEALGEPVVELRLDSQCKYAVVARGQADAYVRLPTGIRYREKIWDHAAGALLASEAGAIVTDAAGRALDFSKGRRLEANRGVICAEESLHMRLIDAATRLGLGQSQEAAHP